MRGVTEGSKKLHEEGRGTQKSCWGKAHEKNTTKTNRTKQRKREIEEKISKERVKKLEGHAWKKKTGGKGDTNGKVENGGDLKKGKQKREFKKEEGWWKTMFQKERQDNHEEGSRRGAGMEKNNKKSKSKKNLGDPNIGSREKKKKSDRRKKGQTKRLKNQKGTRLGEIKMEKLVSAGKGKRKRRTVGGKQTERAIKGWKVKGKGANGDRKQVSGGKGI